MRALVLFLTFTLTLFASSQRDFSLYKLGTSKGPTLLIFGGIHGNEPGGYFAPSILVKHYRISKGSLWIAPNLNFESILRFQRGCFGDMNRKFAAIKKNDPDRKSVERIKRLILNPKVDMILNLHDGHGFYRDEWKNAIFNPKSWGQACIIDQKCVNDTRYGNLDELARRVSKRLNHKLFKNHHIFNVKNTETKMKDEQMRLSLTYFAITHGKPAMAIETSKNITDVAMKVLYQLRAIEAFMDEMGIRYTRDFDLNLITIRKLLRRYGSVVINDNFLIPLDGIDKILRNVPLSRKHNRITRSDHPLAALKRNGRYIEIMVGPKKITTLYPAYIPSRQPLDAVTVETDGYLKQIGVPDRFTFKKRFTVFAPKGIRVNVIGFSKKGVRNESGITVSATKLLPKYAMDRENRLFRVEFYEGKYFRGMVIAEKAKE
ncbi:MAG: hypothetical protein GXO33_05580 [Epsilonproteobacteria bacterium]|nr:hypothetical protein [Campylobacterota bacterium]